MAAQALTERGPDGTRALMEHSDVQGLVVSGYAKMAHANYVLLGVRDAQRARRWLADLADRVTTAERPRNHRCVNVAFTVDGLRALGVNNDDLETFSPSFREGMASANRSRIVGDDGGSDPSHWQWGGLNAAPVHVLVLLFAVHEEELALLMKQEAAAWSQAGMEVVRELKPEPLPGKMNVGKFGIEHFGFADGMSQPVIEGTDQASRLSDEERQRQVLAKGEFVLGHLNGYGKYTPWPTIGKPDDDGWEFGHNGTYLVLRQLSQDVAGFWKFLYDTTKNADGTSNPQAARQLSAKLVGRWPSGAPLVLAPEHDAPERGAENNFGYAQLDPDGLKCPFGSHIRRVNPRDTLGETPEKSTKLANLHRIIRRGRVYGPALDNPLQGDDGQDRGLYFLCLNANIERQFEFIQHTWANSSKFAGLYDEQDPLSGAAPEENTGTFTIQADPANFRISGLRRFVTTRGGTYTFLPGIRALRRLAQLEHDL